jgi:hypothetical protein
MIGDEYGRRYRLEEKTQSSCLADVDDMQGSIRTRPASNVGDRQSRSRRGRKEVRKIGRM